MKNMDQKNGKSIYLKEAFHMLPGIKTIIFENMASPVSWHYHILLSLLLLLSLCTKLLLSSNLIQTIISNFRIRVANQITWLETKNSSIPLVASKDLLLFGKKNRKFFQIFSFIILLIFWYFQYYFHVLKITMQLARLFQNFVKIFLSVQFLIWKL